MRFTEASLKTHGCDDGARIMMFPNSARFTGKADCPSLGLRCCQFCDQMQCAQRCEIVKVLPIQPCRTREEFDCPRLVPVQDLAWKYLLGTKIPKM